MEKSWEKSWERKRHLRFPRATGPNASPRFHVLAAATSQLIEKTAGTASRWRSESRRSIDGNKRGLKLELPTFPFVQLERLPSRVAVGPFPKTIHPQQRFQWREQSVPGAKSVKRADITDSRARATGVSGDAPWGLTSTAGGEAVTANPCRFHTAQVKVQPS